MERYIGKMLDNRYEIMEVIGTGGMAVVFKAKCHRLNRLVAIKMLKKDLSEDADFRRRFHDESQAVAMLSHPNIMAVYDVSRGGDMDYIVMELIDGITLKQYMERRKKLNWPEALHFITQIMKGLSHAHSRGIVHRDIKPQNIMVLRDGTVKVTDFGIACLTSDVNPSNEAIGSVHYISPEQAKGEYTDNRSDIYSAGVVLYEMLTSALPFDGDNPVSVAIQHFSAVPLSPREVNPDIPEAMEQICLKAMAPNRNRRYSTADEMLADLEAFRKDPTVSFDYTAEDLQGEREVVDEPTQYLPNVAVTRKQPVHYAPVEEDEDDEPVKSNWWKHLILVIVVGILGYFVVTNVYSAVMGSFKPVTTPEYVVPDLIGYTVEEAAALPEVDGIFAVVDKYYRYSAEYPAGQIMDQDPVAGRTKKAGDEELIVINVTVSNGIQSGGMPDLIGSEVRSAELTLSQNRDLTDLDLVVIVEEEREFHDEIEDGHVIRTIPEAGTVLRKGDEVRLILSKGPEIKKFTMPSFLGQKIEVVQQEATRLNLVAEFRGIESTEEEGRVLEQSIAPNETVEEGTTVVFTYSEGIKQVQYNVSYNVPYSVFDTHVEIFLDNTLVFDSTLPGDYGYLEVPVYVQAGSYQLRIFVNDQLQEDRVVTLQ